MIPEAVPGAGEGLQQPVAETQAAFPSQKGWGSGSPAPRPFRSGVYAVLAPRSGNERRSIPAKQPVMKPTRRSAGDPSRPNSR